MKNLLNKNILYSAFLISIIFLFACSKPLKTEEPTRVPLTEEQSFTILKSAEAQRVIILQNKFLDNIKTAIGRGIQLEDLRKAATEAVINKREDKFLALIFGSVSAGTSFTNDLQEARKEFLAKNLLLVSNSSKITCSDCQAVTKAQVDKFFINFPIYDKVRLPILPADARFPTSNTVSMMVSDPGGASDNPTCGSWWQEVKLVACAALCSASTAGVGTALCGWACWCMLCPNDSALSKLIC